MQKTNALSLSQHFSKIDFSLMLRPRRTADYEYLHDKITEERIFPRTYEVHCSTEYHADFLGEIINGRTSIPSICSKIFILGSCEEINCEPIKYSPFEGLNMFRRGRSMLSGMLAVGSDIFDLFELKNNRYFQVHAHISPFPI